MFEAFFEIYRTGTVPWALVLKGYPKSRFFMIFQRGINCQNKKKQLLRFSYISQERVARWDRAWNQKEPELDRENRTRFDPGTGRNRNL